LQSGSNFGRGFFGGAAVSLSDMLGDHTLFARADGLERCWQVLQPVLDNMPPVRYYAAGTWGPAEADELIAPRQWYLH